MPVDGIWIELNGVASSTRGQIAIKRLVVIPAKAGIHRQYEAWMIRFAHPFGASPSDLLRVARYVRPSRE